MSRRASLFIAPTLGRMTEDRRPSVVSGVTQVEELPVASTMGHQCKIHAVFGRGNARDRLLVTPASIAPGWNVRNGSVAALA